METKSTKFLNTVAALFLVGFIFFILKELQAILLPLFMAIIIAFLFAPFYEWMKSKRIPSAVAIIIVVVTILVIANLSSVFIYTSIISFNEQLPKYILKGEMIVKSSQSFMQSLNLPPQYSKAIDFGSMLNGEKIAGIVGGLVSGIAGLFTNFILILIYVIFFITELDSIKKRILKAFSADKAKTVSETLNDILTDVRKYIVGKTLVNLAHAITITIIFYIFGLDFALIWGLFTFILAYIPTVGSLISTILPFLTAMLQYDNIFTPVILLVIMTVTGSMFGNIVEPKVLGDKLNLSPLLLLFSLIFWGYLWGVVGMILSVPFMSMIKIVLSKFDSTRPISILMSYDVTEKLDKNQTEMQFKE
ncbi:MAG: AI-2E family transporter [Ignavibacteriae bacterium]|nr:AI-2E family transporter [Ignavibacteriota bacterium]